MKFLIKALPRFFVETEIYLQPASTFGFVLNVECA